MPENWIDEHTSNETLARAGFRTELRAALAGEAAAPEANHRTPWKIIGWSIAAAAVVALVALVVTNGNPDRVGPADSSPVTAESTLPTGQEGSPLRGTLVDVQWTVVTVDGVGVTAKPAPSFTLQHDGRIVGFDGCNQYGFDLSGSGGWTLTGDTLGLDEEMVSTAMGCPDGLTPVIPVADGTQLALDASGRLTLTSPSGRIYIARDARDTTLPKSSQRFVAIGESVMAGAGSYLESAGVLVNTKEGRGPEGVRNAVIQLHNAGDVGEGTTILIHVGNNAPLTQAELDAIMAEVPDDAAGVVFMTLHADLAYVPGNNELIRAMPDKYPNVSVIDWAVKASEVELCADGIHISCNGPEPAKFYTNLILQALGIETI